MAFSIKERRLQLVFKPGDEFEVVAENELDGSFMASPAVTGTALILRTDKALYRGQELN